MAHALSNEKWSFETPRFARCQSSALVHASLRSTPCPIFYLHYFEHGCITCNVNKQYTICISFAKLSSSWQFQLKLSWASSIISVPAGQPSPIRPPQTGKVSKLPNSNKLKFQFCKWKTTSIVFLMEDDIIFLIMEDDLFFWFYERHFNCFFKWKTTAFV